MTSQVNIVTLNTPPPLTFVTFAGPRELSHTIPAVLEGRVKRLFLKTVFQQLTAFLKIQQLTLILSVSKRHIPLPTIPLTQRGRSEETIILPATPAQLGIAPMEL